MFVIPDDFGKKPLNEAQEAGKASFEANDGFILKKLHEAALKKCGKCKGWADEFGVINTGVYGLGKGKPFSLKDSQYEIAVVIEAKRFFEDRGLLGDKAETADDAQDASDEVADRKDASDEEANWKDVVGEVKKGALKVLKNYVAVFAGKDKANAVTADAIHVCRFEASDEIKNGISDGVIAPQADFDSKDLWKLPGDFIVLKVPYSVGLETK